MTAASIPLDDTVAYDLGPIDRIPQGEGQTFVVAGREVAVFRTRGADTVHATQARCPHKAGLLADGIVGDGKVSVPCTRTSSIWPRGHRSATPVTR